MSKKRTKGQILEGWTPFLVVHLSPFTVSLPEDLPRADLVSPICSNQIDKHDKFLSSSWSAGPARPFIDKMLTDGTPIAHAVVTSLAAVHRVEEIRLIYNCSGRIPGCRLCTRTRNCQSMDNSLEPHEFVTEAWPWVQSKIDWKSWQNLVHHVGLIMVVAFVPHPLVQYANQVVAQLNSEELRIAHQKLQSLLRKTNKGNSRNISNEVTSLSLIHEIQQKCTSLPIAILVNDDGLSSNDPTSHLFRHSCLPNSVLDWNHQQKQVELVALYDLDADEQSTVSRTQAYSIDDNDDYDDDDESQRASYLRVLIGCSKCDCVRCSYSKCLNSKPLPDNARDVVRLGYSYFHQSKFEDALRCYRHAVRMDPALDHIWHAIGAVLLAQNKFLQAQQHWRDAVEKYEFLKSNAGISLQLTKQQAFGYFRQSSNGTASFKKECVSGFKPYFDRRCFVTEEPVVSRAECLQIIEWAESEGWTTSRHYAVPTVDVPIHNIPHLLAWFNEWMDSTARPLMTRQFGIDSEHLYCHDAFVVRYEATRGTNFLPVHVDESTHSFVLALNHDFEGGGTYFAEYNTTIAPPMEGYLISFRGNSLWHGANAVTRGTRYILAVFLYYDPPRSRKRVLSSSTSRQESFSFGFQVV